MSSKLQDWLDGPYAKATGRFPERREEFRRSSGEPLDPIYVNGDSDPLPGEYPYTRGIQPTMYRGRLWTMRQYAGQEDAEASNRRYRFLLDQGQTGLSVAFDLPTQIGYDSDAAMAEGEVGKVGVAIDSIDDMRTLFDQIPLDRVTTSMTINSTANILLSLYAAVAEEQGVGRDKIGGTVQNDILKEYVARGTYIYPPKPSMRLITDSFDYCTREVPRWNTISISGYHMREAGCTAAQEVGFTLANAIAYVEAALEQGLAFDDFGPRLSFFFACHSNFLEEIGKVPRRAAALGQHRQGPLRLREPARADAALPHADRGSDADRATAGQQCDSHRAAGAGGGARWNSVAAHKLARRSTWPAV